MRFMSALLLVISVFVSSAFGQEDVSISLKESEWPPIARYAEFESDNADSKIEALEKQCANATNLELRTRYTYWLQGTGEIDGLIDCIKRYQVLRIEIESMPDLNKLKREELELAARLEEQAKRLTKSGKRAKYEIAEATAAAYKLHLMLEIARLADE